MAILFTGWLTGQLLVFFCFSLFLYYVYFKLVTSKHWKKYNVPHMEPVFIFGNAWRGVILEHIGFIFADIHRKWKDSKLVGMWNYTKPTILITDLDIIKDVLTKDFSHFRDRGFPVDLEHDPLAGNLFNLNGTKWRNLRVRLTPTFTSGKMKMMFPTMMECGEELQEFLGTVVAKGGEAELKDVLSRFTIDVIASCAFGIQTNSLKNPDAEFRRYGKMLSEPNFRNMVRGFLFSFFPQFIKIFKIHVIPPNLEEFFVNAVKTTIESREANNIRRNDFMQLLIDLQKKGKLEDVDWNIPKDLEGGDPSAEDLKFTLMEAAAQAFVFFIAGFETTATTISFALHELALNTDIQEALQKEIDQMTEKHGGKMTYEGINEMDLLNRVVEETLRKYPAAPFLFRKCNKDYDIPELNAQIPKNSGVTISVMGIHMDPHIYPNPERFDPDRFLPEEKSKRHHFAYLPFGEGPRMCIGNRFALLKTKVGLVSFLSRFSVEVSTRTDIPLKYNKSLFVLTAKNGISLKVKERKTSGLRGD